MGVVTGGGGGGGGGVSLASPLNNGVATTTTQVACDGAKHVVTATLVSPPSYMSAAGNITAAGIYSAGLQAICHTNPTTSGLSVYLFGPFVQDWIVDLDAIRTGAPNAIILTDTFTFEAADLPFPVICAFQSSAADLTGVLDVSLTVQQLAA